VTPFTTLTSRVMPLIRDNVDTDTIIPSREMRSTGKTGLSDGLFAPWRYLDANSRIKNPDFVLNDADLGGAQILLSGANFGCGSSREHAVWALGEYGFRCIIAESFAPIFENNCVRNGLLPITLAAETLALFAGEHISIDLQKQSVKCGAGTWHFNIGTEAKMMLLEGLDAIEVTLKHKAAIADWLQADKTKRPYIYLKKTP
jgi:3-isopropylmalate/(R)-2-methylmalate dehydratase small subunit